MLIYICRFSSSLFIFHWINIHRLRSFSHLTQWFSFRFYRTKNKWRQQQQQNFRMICVFRFWFGFILLLWFPFYVRFSTHARQTNHSTSACRHRIIISTADAAAVAAAVTNSLNEKNKSYFGLQNNRTKHNEKQEHGIVSNFIWKSGGGGNNSGAGASVTELNAWPRFGGKWYSCGCVCVCSNVITFC